MYYIYLCMQQKLDYARKFNKHNIWLAKISRSTVCINVFIIGNYRFTEIYVEGLQHSEDLQLLIQRYLERFTIDLSVINGIIRSLLIAVWSTCRYVFIIFCLLYRLYREINDLAQNKLQDGTGRRPQYRYHGRSTCI